MIAIISSTIQNANNNFTKNNYLFFLKTNNFGLYASNDITVVVYCRKRTKT